MYKICVLTLGLSLFSLAALASEPIRSAQPGSGVNVEEAILRARSEIPNNWVEDDHWTSPILTCDSKDMTTDGVYVDEKTGLCLDRDGQRFSDVIAIISVKQIL